MAPTASGAVTFRAWLVEECCRHVLAAAIAGRLIETSDGRRSSDFSRWLRTGRLPPALDPDGLELKFKPWHDPANGRFTFAAAGRHYGTSRTDAASGASNRKLVRTGRAPIAEDRRKLQTATPQTAGTAPVRPPKSEGQGPARRWSSAVLSRPIEGRKVRQSAAAALAEFVGGIGKGLYDVGKKTVSGVHAVLTTNPGHTVRNIGRSVAGMIDTAIAAEGTPARIQVSRAANAVADASARDIGHATGMVTGNVALAAASAAALSKAAALRRLRMAKPPMTYDPPPVGWVRETSKSREPWKSYNDGVPGARAGQAPALMRTMTDGSKRPVKFDGI